MKLFQVIVERTITQEVTLEVEATDEADARDHAMNVTERGNGCHFDWEHVDEVDRLTTECSEVITQKAKVESAMVMSWEEMKAAAAKVRERSDKSLDAAAVNMAQTMNLLDFVMFGTKPGEKK